MNAWLLKSALIALLVVVSVGVCFREMQAQSVVVLENVPFESCIVLPNGVSYVYNHGFVYARSVDGVWSEVYQVPDSLYGKGIYLSGEYNDDSVRVQIRAGFGQLFDILPFSIEEPASVSGAANAIFGASAHRLGDVASNVEAVTADSQSYCAIFSRVSSRMVFGQAHAELPVFRDTLIVHSPEANTNCDRTEGSLVNIEQTMDEGRVVVIKVFIRFLQKSVISLNGVTVVSDGTGMAYFFRTL